MFETIAILQVRLCCQRKELLSFDFQTHSLLPPKVAPDTKGGAVTDLLFGPCRCLENISLIGSSASSGVGKSVQKSKTHKQPYKMIQRLN